MSTHELNSLMIYVHPPLAFISYALFYFFTYKLYRKTRTKYLKMVGLTSWFFMILGLLTGMYWAYIAWGSYWSWDPKETLTLILFIMYSATIISLNENKIRLAKIFALMSCIMIVITFSGSFIVEGLHSFK